MRYKNERLFSYSFHSRFCRRATQRHLSMTDDVPSHATLKRSMRTVVPQHESNQNETIERFR